ncbi:hypothetical protein GLOTRDRAFT_132241 [Gloeophyllum trabeum ATCC 11539]|uniref:Aminoglycoside phosphotransferase domain-containing protein n=1 Tax=Gloeophyllum trabeum (strain ATCC 11539 / FP-39264 / Madison 617) TaxID=670483 RepID=S7PWX8_GLOTA|nr:uncharacterized protein GLOTRDRAFT_132241 [Gloeophyllum trabeum ATCC 11539]EPQ52126.1 hypothetical protein GLOTRDRAFT_132241 [Gloeophyllum trabeum ATCC 11539]
MVDPLPFVCVFSDHRKDDTKFWTWAPGREEPQPQLLDWNFKVPKLLSALHETFKVPPISFAPFPAGDSNDFLVTFIDRREYLVKLRGNDSGVSGSSEYDIGCEQATISIVRRYTTIPVRSPVGYNPDLQGVLSTPISIQEHLPTAIPLHQMWPRMSPAQREATIVSIGNIWAQLLTVRYKTIGRLSTSPSGDVRVGPVRVGTSKGERGPFRTVREWLVALALRELLPESEAGMTPEQEQHMGVVAERLSKGSPILDRGGIVLSNLKSCVINHTKLDAHHLLVDTADPTEILAVVGWQHAYVVPLFSVVLPPLELPGCDTPTTTRYSHLMLRQIMEKIPAWALMNSEEARELRDLYQLAKHSHDRSSKGY